jgi:amino acid adenylation domain-containing protein
MKELLKNLRQNNIFLEIENGELKVFANESTPDLSLIAEINKRKAELIHFLSNNDQADFTGMFQLNIPVAPAQSDYPLSFSQKRLWVLSQFEESNIAYNVQGVYIFTGELDIDRLQHSIDGLIERHESLRTVFRQDRNGEVRQLIKDLSDTGFRISFRDIQAADNVDKYIKDLVQSEFVTPFNLSTGPLFRVLICQFDKDKYMFSYVMHHIVSDGWSMNILIKELLLFYNAYTTGQANPIVPLRIHYKDYAVWQQQQLRGEVLQGQKNYWMKQFEGELPVLNLQGDRPRPAVKTYHGDTCFSMLNPGIVHGMKALCQDNGSTLFMGLIAVVSVLLNRYTRQEDIIVGTSIASREHTDLENQIGFYVNTLALRTRFSSDDDYLALLANVKRVTVGAYKHQLYPFDELINLLNLDRDMSRSPLFDVMVVLQQAGTAETQGQFSGVNASTSQNGNSSISKFDLTFFFIESGDDLQLNLAYNLDIYDAQTVKRLSEHLELLMKSVILSPTLPINQLEFLNEAEKYQLSEQFSCSVVQYPVGKSIVDLFEAQVSKTLNDAAVVFETRSLTYQQLNDKANQLANYLISECNTKPDDLVGILLNRSENMIIAMLGIMKSGAAYIAIDPDNPKSRNEFIVKDTGIKALITQTDYLFDLSYYEGNLFAIDVQLEQLPELAGISFSGINKPTDLAYVIYTSGSTGQPKGVMIAHQALIDYTYGVLGRTNMRDCKSFGLVSTIAADLGNTVIYPSLLTGGVLRIFPATDVTNPARMYEANIDCLKIVPAHWKVLQQEYKLFAPNKCLIFGGEQLTKDVIHLLRTNRATCEVYNHYGPSETTVGKLLRSIDIYDPAVTITLGAPFGNTQVYILDERCQLLPVGVPGQIYIGGDGLSRGYLNNPEMTTDKFIANPFIQGAQLYKTGDLGRWLPDGTIEFIGREDDQVKIRGYRIELGEIETALKGYAGIDTAAVITRLITGSEKELLAYVVPNSLFTKQELEDYLRSVLPSYMLPAHYIEIEALPLTANGKINRKALPDPSILENVNYIAPRTQTEEKLVLIWQDVLDKDKIGIKDNFFELGGHSLRATRLSSLINRDFDVNLGLKELFETIILEDQAKLIDEAAKTVFSNIQPVPEQIDYALSYSQRRLWILSQFEEGNAAYNVPGVYVFEGDLDRTAFDKSFYTLIERHESLRTVFRQNEQKEVRQHILTPQQIGFNIGYHDIRDNEGRAAEVEELVRAEFIKPFNLATGPILRINIFQLEEDKFVLVYVMHHIISDGWSKSILINELLALYNAYTKNLPNPLSPLRIQYKDYAAWQQEQLKGDTLAAHKAYWLKHFQGELPVLDLPGGKIRPALKTYSGASFTTHTSRELSDGIKLLSQQQGGTLFMGMLAAVNALFYRYTSQEDIIIGTPIAGREHIDLQDQIGFYANTLALRMQFKGDNSYRDLIDNAKQVTLGAYEHQLYPFDTLVNDLKGVRDMSRNPLFDIQVIVENAQTGVRTGSAGLGDVVVSNYNGVENTASVFDMVLLFVEGADVMQINIFYNNDVYTKTAVSQLSIHLEQILAAIIAAPDKPINQLDFLSDSDRHQLLIDFNASSLQLNKEKTIIHLFEEQVSLAPDMVAVVFGDHQLTYLELDEQSGKLATYLHQTYHLQPGQLVGVMLDRSENLIIAMLAILKAGGVYVPIDPEYPGARKSYIITDTAIQVLITQTEYIFDLSYFQGDLFAIDVQLPAILEMESSFKALVKPLDLAYIIYTSGSTGLPKGVMIEHGALSASIQSQRTIFQIAAGTRSLQFTSPSFDVSVFEIFITLASGASLYIIREQDKKEPFLLERYITDNSIAVASIPPAFLRMLSVEGIRSLQKLITGGESAAFETVVSFAKSGTYYNAYGPTESSLCASVFSINGATELTSANIPIGRPIPGVELYVLDSRRSLVPVGVSGEIYIGGSGLARGYLNSPDLTAAKFIPNPFISGERMYSTGDIGRWLPDGNLEFIGRKDDQVKVNGYRIELGEVEKAIQSYAGIDAAVVITRPDKNGGNRLVCYIVSSEEISSADILSHLSKSLPSYMLPGHFVQLDHLPLTDNGKVDRKQLPDPEGIGMATGHEYVAPRTEAERIMVKIWEELLDKEHIGIRNSFFDLGGDSIKILRMTTELRKELSLDIPITDIYKNNTIEAILEHATINKDEISERNRKLKEKERLVKEEINSLRERILSSADTLNKENIEDVYPMSDIEKGMVYESLMNEGLRVYHDQMVQRKVFIDFDIEQFRLAVKLMVNKHQILRTSFNIDDYETEVQVVHKEVDVLVGYTDISGISRPAQEKYVSDFMQHELDKPFRFKQAPLWRMSVFNFGNDEIIFVFQTHHAIIDGWSDASFITELHNLYMELSENPLYQPEPLKSSYKDFIIQHEIEKKVEEVKDFWVNELNGYKRINLFTDEANFDMFSSALAHDEVTVLEQTAGNLKVNIKAISLTAYIYMLQLLSTETEVVAGLVTNNRPNCEDGDKILGCFLNTIPLRWMFDDNESFADLVTKVHEKIIELKNYEGLSVMEIAQIHQKKSDAGNPFFDMIFNYLDYHTYQSIKTDKQEPVAASLLPINISNYGRTNTFFDFSVNVTGGNYAMGLKLTRKLQSGFSAEKVGRLFLRVLSCIIHTPEKQVKEFELVGEAERQQLLVQFNQPAFDYGADRTITDLFEQQVLNTPNETALLFGEMELSFGVLNERANRLAAYLRHQYVLMPDDLVGILLDRSDWMIVAMLAVLKSGAAYVPLDKEYPQERIDYMMKDCNCKLLINEEELHQFLSLQSNYPATNPEPLSTPANLAYIIYTSGSTGRPKGVMIEHRNVCAFINWCKIEFNSNSFDTIFAITSICFDLSVFEIFYPLCIGKQIRVLSNALSVVEYLNTDERLLLNTVPSVVGTLLGEKVDLSAIKILNMAGEPIPRIYITQLNCQEMEVRNLYGPSEYTTYATIYPIKDDSAILIGRPIANTNLYILDRNLHIQPIGLAGEIFIGGAGLARGYLNNPRLTEDRFIPNPFKKGEKLYRTGDIGKWLPDGNVELAGRIDDQVKIRGYRIELGEIEFILQQYQGIEMAVVTAKPNKDGDKELIAYFSGDTTINVADLRAYLGITLPKYMMPAFYVQLDMLPLTPSGKIDKRNLPDPVRAAAGSGAAYIAPRNQTEEKLLVIWQEILGSENIGMQDNFFELGGHSLKAMRMLARIHKAFNLKLKFEDMLRDATIESIGRSIQRENWSRRGMEDYSGDLVSDQNFIL